MEKLTVKQLIDNIEKCGQLNGMLKAQKPVTPNEKAYHEALGYMVEAYEKLANSYINHIS